MPATCHGNQGCSLQREGTAALRAAADAGDVAPLRTIEDLDGVSCGVRNKDPTAPGMNAGVVEAGARRQGY